MQLRVMSVDSLGHPMLAIYFSVVMTKFASKSLGALML
jgi:hypothetical protein